MAHSLLFLVVFQKHKIDEVSIWVDTIMPMQTSSDPWSPLDRQHFERVGKICPRGIDLIIISY